MVHVHRPEVFYRLFACRRLLEKESSDDGPGVLAEPGGGDPDRRGRWARERPWAEGREDGDICEVDCVVEERLGPGAPGETGGGARRFQTLTLQTNIEEDGLKWRVGKCLQCRHPFLFLFYCITRDKCTLIMLLETGVKKCG